MDNTVIVALIGLGGVIINVLGLLLIAIFGNRKLNLVTDTVSVVKDDVKDVKGNVDKIEIATNSLSHRLEAASLREGLATGNLAGRAQQTAERDAERAGSAPATAAVGGPITMTGPITVAADNVDVDADNVVVSEKGSGEQVKQPAPPVDKEP